jgi:hypothetical protein
MHGSPVIAIAVNTTAMVKLVAVPKCIAGVLVTAT